MTRHDDIDYESKEWEAYQDLLVSLATGKPRRPSTGVTHLKGVCETCWGHGKMVIHTVNGVCLTITLDCPTCNTHIIVYEAKEDSQ